MLQQQQFLIVLEMYNLDYVLLFEGYALFTQNKRLQDVSIFMKQNSQS